MKYLFVALFKNEYYGNISTARVSTITTGGLTNTDVHKNFKFVEKLSELVQSFFKIQSDEWF